MLDGFLERIDRPTVIIRIGEGAKKKPAKYKNTIFAEIISADLVELKGYDQAVDPFTFSAAMRTLYEGGYRFARYERFNGRPRTLTYTLGPDGAETMAVEYHDASAAA